jgi:hypothetical protein
MIKYQLHYKGKDRAKTNFKTKEEAIAYKQKLIHYIKDRILEGRLGYQQYLTEAKNLELSTIDIPTSDKTFSVCERTYKGVAIIKHFSSYDYAFAFMKDLEEDSERHFGILESRVNG